MSSVVEITLLIGLAILSARLIWFIAFGASASDAAISGVGAGLSERQAPPVDYSALITGEVFIDRRAERPTPASQDQAAAPETQLNLSLKGARRGADAQSGSAVIQTPDNRQAVYRVGSEIIDGVSLVEVHPDYVIIDRRGVRESLYLRERDANRADARRADARRAESASSSPAVSASQLLRLAPARRGDELVGYNLTGMPAPILSSLGLSGTDIVTAIDGENLIEADDLEDLLEDAAIRDSVTLTVMRGNETLTVRVDLP